MTASQFASLLHARPVGRGKWIARCVAHPDRNPSLSIAVGKRVPVVIKCMSAGCETKAILDAMGLGFSDLYEGAPTREQYRAIEAERKRQKALEAKHKCELVRLIHQAKYWESEVIRIGKLLESDFDSVKLARQFHWALERSRSAELKLPSYLQCWNVGTPEPLSEVQELSSRIFCSFYEIMPSDEWLRRREEAREREEEWPVTHKGQDPDFIANLSQKLALELIT